MIRPRNPTGMHTFLIVWFGQLVSTFGSNMTWFALKIWAWELTGQATALTLVGFFYLVPSIVFAPFAGWIVDRWNRKWLMMAGDTIAFLSSLVILCLYLTHNLQIWHLYLIGAFNSVFEDIQSMAYTASITMMVSKLQYTRAVSLNSTLHYGSIIIAPALAGTLYYAIGLQGIILIDLVTFMIAIATVLCVRIPQPAPSTTQHKEACGIVQQLTFGFRYIWKQPSLLSFVAVMSLFTFAHDLGAALFSPMILARSGNDARVLGSVSSAAGIGGVTGAVLLNLWGGFKRRIHGLFLGMIGAGLSKAVLGLGQIPLVWLPAQFCSSLNFPLKESSEQAILLSKVAPDVQGRVFATRSMLQQMVSAVAILIAGPLADYVFEPAMMPRGTLAPFLGGVFGVGPGAGMAIIYFISAMSLFLVGVGGYAFPRLRDVETLIPDHDAATE